MDDQLMCGGISCGAITLFQEATDYRGPERREHRRYPRSIAVNVQPSDPRQNGFARPFVAVTREVSRSGLSYISSTKADFERIAISLKDDASRMVVCRVCECNLVQNSESEKTYLTSVEFLYERHV